MTRPQAVPDEAAHRGRPSLRTIIAAVGREVAGGLLGLAGLAGILITVTLLAGPLVGWLIASVLAFLGGLALLFRSEPDYRYPPR